MKTSNTVLGAVVVAVLGLSAVIIAPQAVAAQNFYPGMMCVKTAGLGKLEEDAGSIRNRSSSAGVVVACPVVANTFRRITGILRVTNRHATQRISCTLFASARRQSDSAWIFKTSAGWTSHAGNDVQGFVANTLTLPNSHYHFTCYIPPTYNGQTSEIHTYEVFDD